MADEADPLGRAALVLSTEDSDYNLGIDAAQEKAIELDKRFGEVHSHLKDRFSEHIQHIGMMSFAHEALGGIGLGRTLHPIVHLLNEGFISLEGTLGITAAGLLPVVAGLTAVAGVATLVISHNEKHAESLDQVVTKDKEVLKSTNELMSLLENYQEEIKKTTPELDELAEATARLHGAEADLTEHEEGRKIAANLAAIDVNRKKIESMEEESAAQERQTRGMSVDLESRRTAIRIINDNREAIEKLKVKNDDLAQSNENLKTDIKAQADGYVDTADRVKQLTEDHKRQAEEAKKAGDKEKKAAEDGFAAWEKFSKEGLHKLKEFEAAEDELAKKTEQLNDIAAESTQSAYERRQATVKKFYDDQAREIEKLYQKQATAADGDVALEIQAVQRKTQAMAALDAAYASKQRQVNENIKDDAINAAHSVEAEVNRGLAQMIVESKNAADIGKAIAKNFAETVIQDLLRIMEQAVITRIAVSSIFAGGGIGAGAGGSAGPDAAGAGIGSIV